MEEGVMNPRLATLPPDNLAKDDGEWLKWVESVQIASVIGSRRFKDQLGKFRYVGVGAADIQGKSGMALKNAMRIAQMSAKENLSFAIYSEMVSCDMASSVLEDIAAGSLRIEDAWETFDKRVIRLCKGKIVRGHEVYSSAEIVHPITGRKLFVSVYGIDEAHLPMQVGRN